MYKYFIIYIIDLNVHFVSSFHSSIKENCSSEFLGFKCKAGLKELRIVHHYPALYLLCYEKKV